MLEAVWPAIHESLNELGLHQLVDVGPDDLAGSDRLTFLLAVDIDRDRRPDRDVASEDARDPTGDGGEPQEWGGNRTWKGAEAQAILTSVLATAAQHALDLLPRALVFAVGIQPLLPGRLLAWVERALLHFQQPVHGLFGDLAGDVHRAK